MTWNFVSNDKIKEVFVIVKIHLFGLSSYYTIILFLFIFFNDKNDKKKNKRGIFEKI